MFIMEEKIDIFFSKVIFIYIMILFDIKFVDYG